MAVCRSRSEEALGDSVSDGKALTIAKRVDRMIEKDFMIEVSTRIANVEKAVRSEVEGQRPSPPQVEM